MFKTTRIWNWELEAIFDDDITQLTEMNDKYVYK